MSLSNLFLLNLSWRLCFLFYLVSGHGCGLDSSNMPTKPPTNHASSSSSQDQDGLSQDQNALAEEIQCEVCYNSFPKLFFLHICPNKGNQANPSFHNGCAFCMHQEFILHKKSNCISCRQVLNLKDILQLDLIKAFCGACERQDLTYLHKLSTFKYTHNELITNGLELAFHILDYFHPGNHYRDLMFNLIKHHVLTKNELDLQNAIMIRYLWLDSFERFFNTSKDTNKADDHFLHLWLSCNFDHQKNNKLALNDLCCNIPKNYITNGTTLLHLAAKSGFEDTVKKLLSSQPLSVNVMTANGETPLFFAIKGGHKDIVELLINAGAHVNITTPSNESSGEIGINTLLLTAIENNHQAIFNSLMDHKEIALEGVDELGNTLLHKTIMCMGSEMNSTDISILKRLLEKNNKLLAAPNKMGKTLLHLAVQYALPHIVDLLRTYENTIDVNCKDHSGYAALHHVMLINRLSKQSTMIDQLIAELLKWSAIDLNLLTDSFPNHTPLDLAILAYLDKPAGMLIEQGVNLNISASAAEQLNNITLLDPIARYALSSIQEMLKVVEDSNTVNKSPEKRARVTSQSDEVNESLKKRANR